MHLKSKNIHCIIASLLFLSVALKASAQEASTDYVKKAIEKFSNELNLKTPLITPKLGEMYQGGIVFWLDATKQHGLVASIKDLTSSDGISWRNGESGDRMINAKAKGIYGGISNSRLIVAEQTIDDQSGDFAANLALNWQISEDGIMPCSEIPSLSLCISGWYLPSIFELFLMQSQFNLTGKYWSSTEVNETEALLFNFSTSQPELALKSTQALVRAIHTF